MDPKIRCTKTSDAVSVAYFAGFIFGDRGEFVPKGFDEGVRLWDLRWRET
jgi:hypothetical protein